MHLIIGDACYYYRLPLRRAALARLPRASN